MHILAASLVMLTISSVLSAPIRNNSIKVEDQYGSQDENGFVWGYNLSDGRKVVQNGVIREQTDGTKILVFDGSYSFIGSDGVEYIVEYYADETGYFFKQERDNYKKDFWNSNSTMRMQSHCWPTTPPGLNPAQTRTISEAMPEERQIRALILLKPLPKSAAATTLHRLPKPPVRGNKSSQALPISIDQPGPIAGNEFGHMGRAPHSIRVAQVATPGERRYGRWCRYRRGTLDYDGMGSSS
ncbi:predicted protein [Culex quinquefasciatus]|uniref:Predicted protein n=1 Tax=Culex quinquefasciatus TaxID=7176 RepID=B0WZK5_CULQU|nr:predicted protein [Culex quinquefasciatus]|eukprot:XP_001862827.1 predicted protein [Culex quinquefasciatus]